MIAIFRRSLRRPRAVAIASAALTWFAMQGYAQTITLDAADTGKIFDGIGAVSAGASSRLLIDYPEPQRSQILDFLFKPGYGAALQHLKVEVGSDVNSTDGSEPSSMRSPSDHDYTRGYEWWLMEEARKRNPHILLDVLPWGAPGWIGDGHLYSRDMAEYMADFLRGAETQHHLHIDYVGIWNERMYDSDYVKTLAATLGADHLDTKIVCCDAYPGLDFGEWSIVGAMMRDPVLRNDVAAIGVHYPRDRDGATPAAARDLGVPLWASEDQPNPGGGPFLSRAWKIGGRVLAKQYIANYIDLGLEKTEIWSPITSYYDILAAPNSGLMYANTPWSGHYDVQGTIWATAHTTQFAQPGWQYLDHASGRVGEDISYVSLRAPDRKNWSVVLETIDAHAPKRLHFMLRGGLAGGTVHVWQTDDTHTFAKLDDVPVQGGEFFYTFAPGSLYSLTSTTGQGMGATVIPPAAPFPLPYADDFEAAQAGRSPKYLSDQDGAFEVHSCTDRPGKCLVQQITRKPIPWSPLPDPFTLAGDVGWRDYTVSAEIRIPEYGEATMMGRIESANVFEQSAAQYPAGYILRIAADGHWELLATSYNNPTRHLRSGDLGDLFGRWHSVSLGFRGPHITVSVDHAVQAVVTDQEHPAGMMALGASWSKAEFDDLTVSPD